jgi:hypothetical protein
VPGLIARIGDLIGVLWDHVRDALVALQVIPRYDFDFITARVATGAAPVDEGFVRALQKAGVTHIIDVTDAEDDRSLLPANFPYLYNPTADDGSRKPPEWFRRSLDFAAPALAADPAARVYCHCTSGINRGPSTAYFIIRSTGTSEAVALALFEAHRPQARIGYRADAEEALKT